MHAQTGILQGDPLAPLMFCMTIHDALMKMSERIPDGRLYAYLDDVTMIGPLEQVEDAYSVQRGTFCELGLAINRDKSVLYTDQRLVDTRLRTSNEGLEVIGTPIGTPKFVKDFVHKKLRKFEEKLSKLKNVKSLQDQYILLKLSFQHMITHLCRTVPLMTRGGETAFRRHLLGDEIDRILGGISWDEASLRQVRLPLKMGGLGFDTLMEEYPQNAPYAAFVECCSKTAMKPEDVEAWLTAQGTIHPMAIILQKLREPCEPRIR
jgi:hypothetical protein